MGERIQRLLRSVRLSSVVLIVLGAVLLLCPDFGSKAITLTLGWILILAGGISVGTSLWSRMTFGYGAMGSGLVMLLLGIFLVSRPMVLASLFGVVLGAYLVFSGLGSFSDAMRLRRIGQNGMGGLIWGGVSAVAGVVLMLSPMTSSRFVMSLAGLAMIACGVGSIVTHMRLTRLLENQQDPFRSPFGFGRDDDDDNIIDV